MGSNGPQIAFKRELLFWWISKKFGIKCKFHFGTHLWFRLVFSLFKYFLKPLTEIDSRAHWTPFLSRSRKMLSPERREMLFGAISRFCKAIWIIIWYSFTDWNCFYQFLHVCSQNSRPQLNIGSIEPKFTPEVGKMITKSENWSSEVLQKLDTM